MACWHPGGCPVRADVPTDAAGDDAEEVGPSQVDSGGGGLATEDNHRGAVPTLTKRSEFH